MLGILALLLLAGGLAAYLVYKRLTKDRAYKVTPLKKPIFIPKVRACYEKVDRRIDLVVFIDSSDLVDVEAETEMGGY